MTISFNNIGRHGRLGNQMFQYASLRGIASHQGYSFTIPPSNGNNEWTDHQLFKCFNLGSLQTHNIGYSQHRVVNEKGFDFDDNLFHNCSDNIDILGYLQSEKYFLHIQDSIKQDFTFHNHIETAAKQTLDKYYPDPLISLHIRKTDYKNCAIHDDGCCSMEYYEQALSLLDSSLTVLILTDDIDWVSNQDFFKEKRYVIHNPISNAVDMCMMTMCDYNIIANSSFSWWGAWLGKHKKVIAPKKWFGSRGPKSWSDIYCPEWLIV